ncbi:MAG: hypothetical protein WCB98_01495 [Candidatus Aquirickettsiella gammari]
MIYYFDKDKSSYVPNNVNTRLKFTIKYYDLFENRSIVVCTAASPEDKKFNLQLRFIQDKTKQIDFTQLTNNLKQCIEKINSANRLILGEENERRFFNDLKNSGFDLKFTDIIQDGGKTICKNAKNQPELSKEYNKELLALFSLDTIKINHQIRHIGYEMPKNTIDNDPIPSIYIFDGRKLIKKIYLFPFDETSLQKAKEIILAAKDIDNLKLEIPFVAYNPRLNKEFYDEEIQTRIDLQTIIAETLMHLKPTKFFRKDNSEKIQIFNALAKKIAAGESLKEIRQNLNQHDKWQILSQHRDPWGIFSFFKGKTHSVMAWELLNERLGVVFSADANTSNTVLTRH